MAAGACNVSCPLCAALWRAVFWLPGCLIGPRRSTNGPRRQCKLHALRSFVRHAVFWLPVCSLCSLQCTRGRASIANCLPCAAACASPILAACVPVMLAAVPQRPRLQRKVPVLLW